MDCAFETVEGVRLATHEDLKGFVVVISAMFANAHWILLDLITRVADFRPDVCELPPGEIVIGNRSEPSLVPFPSLQRMP